MSIDLNKDKNELKYYYSENGATLGPFTLTQLLEKIEADTLVYREGIDWTNARDVEELRELFKAQQTTTSDNIINTNLSTASEDGSHPKKMFSAPFSFDGRIRRTEYGISFIIYIFAYSIIATVAKSSTIVFVAFIPLFWFLWAQGAKRCHDRGNSGWYQIIPFYVFWMLFAESDSTKNEYGNSPK
ncbi:MAG: DUF805 domain-containing protein [Pedobacter sp.]|nr:DUF805 domain-containing protein [Pedobacter sp.]